MENWTDKEKKQWTTRVRGSLDAGTADYLGVRARLMSMRELFHDELAKVVEPLLNDYLAKQPQGTLAEKAALATWCNSQLREFGLSIRCPLTGQRAILVADIRDRDDEGARFRLLVTDETGRRARSLTSRALPHLELIRGAARVEGRAKGGGYEGR